MAQWLEHHAHVQALPRSTLGVAVLFIQCCGCIPNGIRPLWIFVCSHSTLLEFPREVNMVFSWFGSFSFTSIFYFTKMTLIWSHLWPYTDSTWLTWRFGHQMGQEPQKEALQMHYPAQHHLALAPHHLAPPQMQHPELQAYHWGAQRCHCPPSSPSIQGHGTVVYCVTDIIFKHLSNCLCSIDLEL